MQRHVPVGIQSPVILQVLMSLGMQSCQYKTGEKWLGSIPRPISGKPVMLHFPIDQSCPSLLAHVLNLKHCHPLINQQQNVDYFLGLSRPFPACLMHLEKHPGCSFGCPEIR